MEKRKAGIVTMGCAGSFEERRDIVERMGPQIETLLAGILDDVPCGREQELIGPKEGESFIVTRNAQGVMVKVAEQEAQRRAYLCVKKLREQGAESVLILCTGNFSPPPEDKGLLYIPEHLLYGILRGFQQKGIGFIVPEPEQIGDSLKQYADLNPVIKAANPYGSMETLEQVAATFREEPVELIVTDCMGFTKEMGQLVARASGKQVLVPRVVLPNMIRAILTQEP